jgi:hypothetical protein
MAVQELSIPHLDEGAVARYHDGALDAFERARIEAHLADCPACLQELLEISRLLQSQPRHRWKMLVPLAGVAAALLVWAIAGYRLPGGTVSRDPALTTTLAPQPVAPVGIVPQVDSLIWSAVPGARRYRLALFAADGRVLWQIMPTDTAVALPDSLRLVASTRYYWQVKAETGYGRWVESELESFSLESVSRP